MSTHTPTPYMVELHNQTAPTIANQFETVAELATLSDDGQQELANARFIVTACNAHAALVAALQAVTQAIDDEEVERSKLGEWRYRAVVNALALAGGKEPS